MHDHRQKHGIFGVITYVILVSKKSYSICQKIKINYPRFYKAIHIRN